MLYLVKLNAQYYRNNIDKNSGSYEFENIKNVLSKSTFVCEMTEAAMFNADTDFFVEGDILVLVSGMIDEEVRTDLINLIESLKFAGCKTVFLNTDLRVANKCNFYKEDFRLSFDLFLDQNELSYNYVPETFVTNYNEYTHSDFNKRSNCVIFGGNIDNRVEKIMLANQAATLVNIPVVPLIASKLEKIDKRLPYKIFKDVSRCYRYTFVVSDKEYDDANFLTSRIFEALDSNLIPFVDADYDKFSFVVPADYRLIYRSKKELADKMKLMDEDVAYRNTVFNQLNKMKHEALKRQKLLAEAILR